MVNEAGHGKYRILKLLGGNQKGKGRANKFWVLSWGQTMSRLILMIRLFRLLKVGIFS
jgi:hypothetical protein